MDRYQTTLKAHLADYAAERLGVREPGVYRGRYYRHILPYRFRFLNILESYRAEIQDYLRKNPSIHLHRYFHHLNSSQALTFNLFFPFLSGDASTRGLLTGALEVPEATDESYFEFVQDANEGTNVDVAWSSTVGGRVFCEVKLSEDAFGAADHDARHRRKRIRFYLPRLATLVEGSLLEEPEFFRHYQLLRNIAFLADDPRNHLVILVPKENQRLEPALEHVIGRLKPPATSRVHVVYLEELLARLLAGSVSDHPLLVAHIEAMQEKYVVSPNSNA